LRRLASSTAAVIAVAASLSLAIPAGAAVATSAGPASRASTSPAPLTTITITMTGKKISVTGALQSGGARILSKVTGEPQGAPTLVRLAPGVSLAKFFATLKTAAADPNNLDGVASIVVNASARRGTSSVQAKLGAGTYVALDTVRGNPAMWPLTTFAIAKAAHPAPLPAPKATITAIEFGFRGPGRLHDGELVRFVNHGFLVHMIVYITARSLARAREIARLLRADKEDQATALASGFGTFAGPFSRDGGQQFILRSKHGYYVLACFMETQVGRDHTALGMERVIRIVK
jgi:hypothetical protein